MDAATRAKIAELRECKRLNMLRVSELQERPPNEDAELVKCFRTAYLIGFHISYLITGNPLFVWSAYHEVRRHKEVPKWEMPEWILEYLDSSYKSLCAAVDIPSRAYGGWPGAVARAFGLGHESRRSSYRKAFGNLDLSRGLDRATLEKLKTDPWGHLPPAQRNRMYVLCYVEKGMTRKAALEAAHEESGVPIKTLERDYDRHKSISLQK